MPVAEIGDEILPYFAGREHVVHGALSYAILHFFCDIFYHFYHIYVELHDGNYNIICDVRSDFRRRRQVTLE